MTVKLRKISLATLVLLSSAAATSDAGSIEAWLLPGVSSDQFESYAALDPLSADLYFVRSSKTFSGWRILKTHCSGGRWSNPVEPSFSALGVEADPFITADGKHFYYISTRATGSTQSADFDIWRIDRRADGRWSEPHRLPAPVNSGAAEWFPRPAIDGWLYFGSNRPGGVGKNDIWRARQLRNGVWRVENLGPNINSTADEYEPLPSPDGSWMLINAGDGYYRSNRTKTGWSAKRRLGPEINANGSEVGATFSPSGRTVIFSRDLGEPRSGEFLIWHYQAREAWPVSCVPKRLVTKPAPIDR